MVLLTIMDKFCHAIIPPYHAKEPPLVEASSYLDTNFPTDINRLYQLVVLLHGKVVFMHHKSNFVIQFNSFPTKVQGGV